MHVRKLQRPPCVQSLPRLPGVLGTLSIMCQAQGPGLHSELLLFMVMYVPPAAVQDRGQLSSFASG